MLELIAKTIGTAVASGVAKEVASHSGDFVDGALEVAGDTIEFAGDCVCGILDGIGSLFDQLVPRTYASRPSTHRKMKAVTFWRIQE